VVWKFRLLFAISHQLSYEIATIFVKKTKSLCPPTPLANKSTADQARRSPSLFPNDPWEKKLAESVAAYTEYRRRTTHVGSEMVPDSQLTVTVFCVIEGQRINRSAKTCRALALPLDVTNVLELKDAVKQYVAAEPDRPVMLLDGSSLSVRTEFPKTRYIGYV
jgi:hypothetical protein